MRLVWILLVLLGGCKEVIDLSPAPADAAISGDAAPWLGDAGVATDGG